MSRDVPVIDAHCQFALWYVQRIEESPRSQRFVLGDRVEVALPDVLELLLEAEYSTDKAEAPRRANLHLEQIRFVTCLAADLGLISRPQQLHAARCVNEVNQQIGGLLASRAREARR